MPAIPELTGTLTDGVVSLRLYAERDIPEILIAYQDDPHLHERLGQARPPSGAELGSESERAAGERAAGLRVSLTLLEPGSDVCVGRVIADELAWNDGRAELKVWVAPGHRGCGLAPAALRLAAGWLFDRCGFVRAGLRVDPANEPMLRAAAAAGFSREGVLRSYERERHGRHDVVSMSLIAEDLS
jgi:RimJ/RimL family protein N-acetyltransferase